MASAALTHRTVITALPVSAQFHLSDFAYCLFVALSCWSYRGLSHQLLIFCCRSAQLSLADKWQSINAKLYEYEPIGLLIAWLDNLSHPMCFDPDSLNFLVSLGNESKMLESWKAENLYWHAKLISTCCSLLQLDPWGIPYPDTNDTAAFPNCYCVGCPLSSVLGSWPGPVELPAPRGQFVYWLSVLTRLCWIGVKV